MKNQIFLLGYGSLLLEQYFSKEKNTPVLLHGWNRYWGACQIDDFHSRNRMICSTNGKILQNTAYFNLQKQKKSIISAIIYPISYEKLQDMIYREIGYELIDVSNDVTFFNYKKTPFKIFTFISPKNKFLERNSYISFNYYKMCFQGAQLWNKINSSFLFHFQQKNDKKFSKFQKKFFLSIASDGKTLTALDLPNYKTIFIHQFKYPLIFLEKNLINHEKIQCLHIQNYLKINPCCKINDFLLNSNYWLYQLIQLDHHLNYKDYLCHSDLWVRRYAQVIQSF
jgi:hypothetical protein